MGRKFFVGGNWKMNGDKASIDVICDFLVKGPTDPNVEVVVSCSPCYLMYVRDKLPADKFGVAAQNCHKAAKGAFTGKYVQKLGGIKSACKDSSFAQSLVIYAN